MFTISIGKAETNCPDKITLTSGMVKAVQVAFNFSDEWEGFIKTAIFSNGSTTTDVPLDKEDKCYIPHEVLAVPGEEVTVGVYGCKGEGDDYVAIPTEKQSLGEVIEGVDPLGEEPKEPTPTVWDELKIKVENMYSKEEINELFAKKDHTHDVAKYEKNVRVSLIDITTGGSGNQMNSLTTTAITESALGTYNLDIQGEVEIIARITAYDYKFYVDDTQLFIDEYNGIRWSGKIKQGITVVLNDGKISFNKLNTTIYTDGFMSGEQAEKLANVPTTEEVENLIAEAFGTVEAVFDEVHEYAESLGGDEA